MKKKSVLNIIKESKRNLSNVKNQTGSKKSEFNLLNVRKVTNNSEDATPIASEVELPEVV